VVLSEIIQSEHWSRGGLGIRSYGATSPSTAPGGLGEAELAQRIARTSSGFSGFDHTDLDLREP
jgi:hypothetical protein